MSTNSKLHDLHIRSYKSYPQTIVIRHFSLLYCVYFEDDIVIQCSQVYINNKRVNKQVKSALVSSYRMGLIDQQKNGKIKLTPLGEKAIYIKENSKPRVMKLSDVEKKYKELKIINNENRINKT